jgi:hypothetical protein
VSVSIAAGVAAITSALPRLHSIRVGCRSASSPADARQPARHPRVGRIFAVPTYFFIVSILACSRSGAWRYLTARSSRARRHALPPARTLLTLSCC